MTTHVESLFGSSDPSGRSADKVWAFSAVLPEAPSETVVRPFFSGGTSEQEERNADEAAGGSADQDWDRPETAPEAQSQEGSRCSSEFQLPPLTLAQRLHLVVEEPDSGIYAKVWSVCIMSAVFLSIGGFILSTVEAIQDFILWKVIDIGSFILFFSEYIIRLAVCNAFDEMTRCQFLKAPMNVVDCMSLVPVFLFEDVQSLKPLKVFRAVRLVRIFRIFKISRYMSGVKVMTKAVLASGKTLARMSVLLLTAVMWFSTLMYNFELLSCPPTPEMTDLEFLSYREECTELGTGWSKDGKLCCDRRGTPDAFPSILAAAWWAFVTMTTVGYGDKVPRTGQGRLVGAAAMITGIILISVPVAIVGTKFDECYQAAEEEKRRLRLEVATSRSASSITPDRASPKSTFTSAPDGQPPRRTSAHLDGVDVDALRAKLRRMEGRRKLSVAAREEVGMLLELFDHLDRLESRLHVLREKDRELDGCIREDFAALALTYRS